MFKDLEYISRRTWHRTRLGWDLDIHQGEETFTDINLLDLAMSSPHHHIVKTSKDDEAETGTDWEWYIRFNGSWRKLAIQAKKVAVDGKYKKLSYTLKTPHKLKHIPLLKMRQIDILDIYARSVSAIPLYVLFNYDASPTSAQWQCGLKPLEPEQLGCTIATLGNIQTAVNTRGSKSFNAVHRRQAFPWRCLICNCPNKPPVLQNMMTGTDGSVEAATVESIFSQLVGQEITYSPQVDRQVLSEILERRGILNVFIENLDYFISISSPKFVVFSDADGEINFQERPNFG